MRECISILLIAASAIIAVGQSDSEIYRVGAGDRISISVNAASNTESTVWVRADGTIDFPLAGGVVRAAGKTVDQLESSISQGIRVYRLPKVRVRVVEYVSHTVRVEGLVSIPGVHAIQRETVPLFVIRAMAEVLPSATHMKIERADKAEESYSLDYVLLDRVLIRPGDTVSFRGIDGESVGYFFLTGTDVETEKRTLRKGQTLMKTIHGKKFSFAEVATYASSGEITRKLYEFKALAKGKIADPIIRQGDIVSFR